MSGAEGVSGAVLANRRRRILLSAALALGANACGGSTDGITPLPGSTNTNDMPAECGGFSRDPDCVCGPQPLAEACELTAIPCPAKVHALPVASICGQKSGGSFLRFASSCGGTVFQYALGGGTEWSFDAAGNLTGIAHLYDTLHACPAGGQGNMTIYGEPCAPTGTGEPLCTSAGSGPSTSDGEPGAAGGASP